MKPIVGITMGDPAGIGPEIIIKSLMDSQIYSGLKPLVIGNYEVMSKTKDELGIIVDLNEIKTISDAKFKSGTVDILDIPLNYKYTPGKMNIGNGKAALDYIYKAIDLVNEGKIHSIATAPTNKEAMKMAGSKFSGATEIFAFMAKVTDFSTIIEQGGCYIFQLTTHMPLKDAISKINTEFLYEKIKKAYEDLIILGINNPKIGLSGLNPHAGDGGVLGREETEIFYPAIVKLRNESIDISDPIPVDAIFNKGYGGEYDALMIMYHDAANIAIKLMSSKFATVVITGGLPYVRTTVAHGTAYDIANKGIADFSQMKNAIITAGKISQRKYFSESGGK